MGSNSDVPFKKKPPQSPDMIGKTPFGVKLGAFPQEIHDVADSARAVRELRDQLAPRVNEAVHALIEELADIEEDFLLEDLVFFVKKLLCNIRNINFALE